MSLGDTHAAHEATESIWADNVVLPVYKSGGAAGGDFDFRMDKVRHQLIDWLIV